ncbi:GNAT family N-acetyltransferase [Dactylosporangium sucinum]|uniref:GNAT family N-acetyltransferase n=1 Tax=Dactylosporangium sucinum TaxID=1424081 RepID=UPI001E460D63|nr:GNAT family N-acetyltransferase [Dactylosporangium sucinum]
MDVRVVHSSALAIQEHRRIRRLLDTAFGGRFGDDDMDHALGGLHVLVEDDQQLVGHASVVQRRLFHQGKALRAGYVEAVAAHPQRHGHGARVMAEVERIVRGGYTIGALSASEGAVEFYRRRGWVRWEGPTAVLAPDGLTRTPDDDDSTYVLRVEDGVDIAGLIACDWRDGDVW